MLERLTLVRCMRWVLVSIGCRGGTKAGLLAAYAVRWPRTQARALRGSSGQLRAQDAGVMALHPTRLETRTKESNMYASRWVANP